jgi:hypothetical protein
VRWGVVFPARTLVAREVGPGCPGYDVRPARAAEGVQRKPLHGRVWRQGGHDRMINMPTFWILGMYLPPMSLAFLAARR